MTLRRVDPPTSHGWLFRLYMRLLATGFAGWLSRTVLWKVDPVLLRISGGRLGMSVGVPTALLETRGARTGLIRHNAVIYFHDGDDVIVVASKLGLPEHPGWFHNAVANPDVELGGESFRAAVVGDEHERRRLFECADRVLPLYAVYRQRTTRAIPILRLAPS
jgi:deazaflavin-dependent oxidoreductase (nitroreductase family)